MIEVKVPVYIDVNQTKEVRADEPIPQSMVNLLKKEIDFYKTQLSQVKEALDSRTQLLSSATNKIEELSK
jgi:hypothetical protein